jgi:hypothetical protein
MGGRNTPGVRLNDEDESRTVGVIAYHVAHAAEWIVGRIQNIVEGVPTPPVDFKVINAREAATHSDVTTAEVVALLRKNKESVGRALRAIPDDKLDIESPTPMGSMTVEQRILMILIGHIEQHRVSIEATIAAV